MMTLFKKEQLRLLGAILGELKSLRVILAGAILRQDTAKAICDLERSIVDKKNKQKKISKAKRKSKKARKARVHDKSLYVASWFSTKSPMSAADAYKVMCSGFLGAPMSFKNFRSIVQHAESVNLLERHYAPKKEDKSTFRFVVTKNGEKEIELFFKRSGSQEYRDKLFGTEKPARPPVPTVGSHPSLTREW